MAKDELSGGFSGAELIAICRDAALLALEEHEKSTMDTGIPKIHMRHMLQAMKGMQRQITPEMLEFYESFNKSRV